MFSDEQSSPPTLFEAHREPTRQLHQLPIQPVGNIFAR